MKVKTSLSIRRETLRKVKAEAKRRKRSVSQLVEIWIEETLTLPANKPEARKELVPV